MMRGRHCSPIIASLPVARKGTDMDERAIDWISREMERHLSAEQLRLLRQTLRSFPKLKIPHQSHADFCSTDTAGGLDNKKRRYAPRGGVTYRLFLWGFPKGATPPYGTRLCEAKCSVLYALPALP